MSLVTIGKHNGRPTILVGLNREDIDHLIGGDIVYLEARAGVDYPDLGIFAGETNENLQDILNRMGKDV